MAATGHTDGTGPVSLLGPTARRAGGASASDRVITPGGVFNCRDGSTWTRPAGRLRPPAPHSDLPAGAPPSCSSSANDFHISA